MANNDAIDSANIPPPLSHGGSGAQLVASNGGIIYTDATKMAVLAATATGNQPLLSGASGAPGWSTTTFPGSTTINQILYSSAANTLAGLATANNGILITSAGGVPSISSTPPAAVLNAIPGRLKSFQVFTTGTAATYTTPAGITTLLVETLGGGGGGGGSNGIVTTYSAGGGGGAGGYGRNIITSAAASYTYTVGAGGTAGAAGGGTGGTGGQSLFAGSIAGNGGSGGVGGASVVAGSLGGVGGLGGAGVGNISAASGTPGKYGTIYAAAALGGAGGSSLYGGGAISTIGSQAGFSATANSGGGGAGGASALSGSTFAGGVGGSGLIVVWEFS